MLENFIRAKNIYKKSVPKLIRIDLVEIDKGEIINDQIVKYQESNYRI